ncbi:MAG: hypothetical protein FVQ79_00220 [Planctomycetes bacterium]|nr:hypothetical protein [Planctomycetota bacterium]
MIPQTNTAAAEEEISLEEAVELGASDAVFFNHYFFARAFRQDSPPCHYDIVQRLEYRGNRYFAAEVARDWAKTTLLRAYAGKRIAYAISRTILFVGPNEKAAIRSAKWIKKQVEFNTIYAQAFELTRGGKWADDEFEIRHGLSSKEEGREVFINVLAVGIYGSTRGINIDDYRPDLIVVDDPCDEINTHTMDQRNKTAKLFFGAIYNALAPETEMPHAKMVLLQTGLHREDLIHICHKDPSWETVRYSVFDKNGESTWPQRYPTATLLREKEAFIRRGHIHLWLREKECRIISEATAAFRLKWLKYWNQLPPQLLTFMGIDPASSESKTADFTAIVVVGYWRGICYLCDYSRMKTHNPEEVIMEFFRLADIFHPRNVTVETVGYQRILATLLRSAMRSQGQFYRIIEQDDKRKKQDRIRQALTGRVSNGFFWINKENHTEWVSEYVDFPDPGADDDLLDATAMAMASARPDLAGGSMDEALYSRHEMTPALVNQRGAP